jgi:hypothetical protein
MAAILLFLLLAIARAAVAQGEHDINLVHIPFLPSVCV